MDDKLEREAKFPLELIEIGYTLDITKAQASVALDRQRILNCIAGVERAKLDDTEPDTDNELFSIPSTNV